MKHYTMMRWQCTACGLKHSLIQGRGPKPKLWVCPVCDHASMPSHTCTGMCETPDYGAAVTFVLVQDFGDGLRYPRELVGWDGKYVRVANV